MPPEERITPGIMKQFWKYFPVLLPAVLYLGALNQRGLWTPDELLVAAVAAGYPAAIPEPVASLNRWLTGLLGNAPWVLHLVPLAATLLTGTMLMVLARQAMPRIMKTVGTVYFSTALVFFAGTAALPLAPAILALALLVCGAAGVLLQQRPPLIRLGFFIAMLAGASLLLRLAPYLRPGTFGQQDPAPLLVLGLLPWLLLLPLVLSGLRHTPWHNPLLWGAGAGIAGALFLTLANGDSVPAALPGMTPFLALFTGCGLEHYFEREPDGARFNRLLRTYSIMAGTAATGLLALQLLGKFGRLPQDRIPYGNDSAGLIAAIALIVLICWWWFAMRENAPRIKIDAFAVGAAFVLLSSQLLIPPRVRLTLDGETPLRRYVAPLLQDDTLLVAERSWGPAAWLLRGERDFRVLRPDGATVVPGLPEITAAELAAAIVRDGRRVVLLRRAGPVPPELPPPRQRMYFRPVDLSIMEFGNR